MPYSKSATLSSSSWSVRAGSLVGSITLTVRLSILLQVSESWGVYAFQAREALQEQLHIMTFLYSPVWVRGAPPGHRSVIMDDFGPKSSKIGMSEPQPLTIPVKRTYAKQPTVYSACYVLLAPSEFPASDQGAEPKTLFREETPVNLLPMPPWT